ncbi:MAG: amidohydrolase family protein [Chitinophagales bacterium]
MKNTLLLFFFLIISCSLQAQTTVLHCGNVIDTEKQKMLGETTITIVGNKIAKVEKGYVTPKTADQIIDLKDKTVLPGLMDMHVHIESQSSKSRYLESFTLNEADYAFRAAQYAQTTLMAGFTTVRDLGGSGVNVALRNAINKGIATGPRIYTAEKTISITGGHGDPTNGHAKHLMCHAPGPHGGIADGEAECIKAVRQRVKNGADCIKITATGGVLSLARDGKRPQFNEEEIRAIVKTANDVGIHVAAHAHGAEGIKRAIRSGVTTIEHGTLMDEEGIRLMKQYDTYLVPTITAGRSTADSAKIEGYYPPIIVPKILEISPQSQKTFGKAYKAGVKIAFGTDAGVFRHGRNAVEFAYMVEAGMPAMEAIHAATITTSELLEVTDKLGSISEGKLADIIAVSGNPVEDITLLQRVDFVMKDGKVYKQ